MSEVGSSSGGPALVVRVGKTVEPIAKNVALYDERYAFFRSLYPRFKDAYRELSAP